jgi:hypothetical protein
VSLEMATRAIAAQKSPHCTATSKRTGPPLGSAELFKNRDNANPASTAPPKKAAGCLRAKLFRLRTRSSTLRSRSEAAAPSRGIARLSFVGRQLALSTDVGFRRFDVARMSQTTMNIAAITGPSTMPFIPRTSSPPSVEISTT